MPPRPALTLLALLVPAPALALPAVEENEALVMRLVFEDCLGYVRDDREPFGGLHTEALSPGQAGDLPRQVRESGTILRLLSARYAAAFGEDEFGRYCMVVTSQTEEADGMPGLLGVEPGGFLPRVTARAAAEGLTDAAHGDTFTPLQTSYWSEPETGHDSGPLRPVSVTIMPTGEADGLLDAGLLVMGGPARRPAGATEDAPGETGDAAPDLDALLATVADTHPSTYFQIAAMLLETDPPEAAKWLYVAQIRYRFHIAAQPDLDPSGDPALFASLFDVIGRPVNETVAADYDAWTDAMDRALAWDAANPNGFTSKSEHAEALREVRAGLEAFRADLDRPERREAMERSRRESGLPVR